MKQHLVCLATLLISSSWCFDIASFTSPAIAAATPFPEFARDFQLFRRDGNCPTNYNTCSNEGNSGICCESGTTCTVDAANNIACCPTGAKCTGSLGATATGGSGGNSASTTTTSGFIFPQGTSSTTSTTTTSTASTASTASITGSTIAGAAYPFIYIPTTFSNAATCSSYYSLCQSEYSSCLITLGGQYGVTIAGGNGGVTVEGNSAVTSASAAISTCSSLSQKACYGLQESYCTAFGTSGETTTTGGQFVTGSNAPMRKSSLHEILIAVAAGVVGMFL